jgi:hypothetical protein
MIVSDIEIAAGNLLSLTCPINGNPQPTISWLHVCNFSNISKPPTVYFLFLQNHLSLPIQFTFEKDLQKPNVNISDSGSYECIGVNLNGRASFKYTVNVFGRILFTLFQIINRKDFSFQFK